MFQFARLIRKYEKPYQLVTESPGTRDPSTGRYMPGPTVTEDRNGAILPVTEKLIYQSGGRITTADRLLYSADSTPLPAKAKVLYKGESYSVEEMGDFTDHADFRHYLLRRVSAFD